MCIQTKKIDIYLLIECMENEPAETIQINESLRKIKRERGEKRDSANWSWFTSCWYHFCLETSGMCAIGQDFLNGGGGLFIFSWLLFSFLFLGHMLGKYMTKNRTSVQSLSCLAFLVVHFQRSGSTSSALTTLNLELCATGYPFRNLYLLWR